MTEFVDSFQVYIPTTGAGDAAAAIDSLCTRWNAGGQSVNFGQKAGIGLGGTSALIIGQGGVLCKTHSRRTGYTAGFRVAVSSAAGVGGGPIHSLNSIGLGSIPVEMATLKINIDGSLLLYAAGDVTKVVALSGIVMAAGTFSYIEYQVTTSGTANILITGSIWCDGVLVATGTCLTGYNVNAFLNGGLLNRVFLRSGVNTPGQAIIQDYYLNNNAGATNTGPFGIVKVQPLFPNADTGIIAWTPSVAGTHFSLINENPSDLGSTYVKASIALQRDIYRFEPIPSFIGTVKSVQLSWLSRQNNEGPKTYCGTIGPFGTEISTPTYAPCSNYEYDHKAFDVDPLTGIAWTQPNFNVKPFGLEILS